MRSPHRVEHFADWSQRIHVGLVIPEFALATDADRAGLTQEPKMLRHGAERDRQTPRDVAGAQLVLPDQFEDALPGRIAHELEKGRHA